MLCQPSTTTATPSFHAPLPSIRFQTPSPPNITQTTGCPTSASNNTLAANNTSQSGQYSDGQYRISSSSAYKNKSPEIHDLIRFQNAVMMKYNHTHDQHFKNIADALKPQIEEKIREFNRNN